MNHAIPNHYAVLGLDRKCSLEQIRAAYRILARQHHPDLNQGSEEAGERTRELNAAYEVLSDPSSREAYDRQLSSIRRGGLSSVSGTALKNLKEEVQLGVEEFIRGTTLELRLKDPSGAGNVENYLLTVPPMTAPGSTLRIERADAMSGGQIRVKLRVRPHFRFKARGFDLRCDLQIRPQRAEQGGMEMVQGPLGDMIRVGIERGIGRGQIVRIPGEGLPRPRGGRGDLLVRVLYRVEVRFRRVRR